MAQRTQRKNVRTTTDKIEYWKVLARFICYGGDGTTIYMRRSHRPRRAKGWKTKTSV